MYATLVTVMMCAAPNPEVSALLADVSAGRTAVAMERMAQRIVLSPPLCEQAHAECHALMIAGLDSADVAAQRNALVVFSIERWHDEVAERMLVRKAADVAAGLEAWSLSASMLASVTARVAERELDAHLLTVAQRFVKAGDRAHANVALRYAELRLGPRTAVSWMTVRQAVARAP